MEPGAAITAVAAPAMEQILGGDGSCSAVGCEAFRRPSAALLDEDAPGAWVSLMGTGAVGTSRVEALASEGNATGYLRSSSDSPQSEPA